MTEDDVLRALANAQEYDRYKQPWQTVEDEQISEALWREYHRLKEALEVRAAQHFPGTDEDATKPLRAPAGSKSNVNQLNTPT